MMKYRKFGSMDWDASALGFGAMRLPTTDNLPMSPNIIEDEAIRMIRRSIDGGVNYVDTAYPYHGGQSEVVTGKALKDGYREKVRLATKSPVWLIEKPDDFDKLLDEQLKRLDMDFIDFYLLHALGKESWENKVLKHTLFGRAEKAMADGRIKHLGFSFHDDAEHFQPIVDGYDNWAFCQIQYNYMDTENQAGTAGLRYAASKGIAVVVMEPLLGGKLADPPAPIQAVFDKLSPRRSPVDLALQWIWDQPEVSMILSGMTTMEHVEGNLASADKSGVGSFTEQDEKLVAEVRKEYEARVPIPCTKCGYCVPCPNGVAIIRNFELYNNGFIHEAMDQSSFAYSRFFSEEERAGSCVACLECEEHCPQKIKIAEWMVKVHAALGETPAGG